MTRTDLLTCIHEPFGDAFYYGPERLSSRFDADKPARLKSGFSNTTYASVLDSITSQIASSASKYKRVFIKDIIHYLFPPDGKPAVLAPSLASLSKGAEDEGNPTVVPLSVLRKFHFTFLIRHPRRAIPSYYRCTVPPLDEVTGFYEFMPSEAGYDELRRIFDFLRRKGVVGEGESERDGVNGVNETNGNHAGSGANGVYGRTHCWPVSESVKITVIDADDLLDRPAEVIRAYCEAVGIDYRPEMLAWEDAAHREQAAAAFEKWNGFHNDAIGSTSLRPRANGVVCFPVPPPFVFKSSTP